MAMSLTALRANLCRIVDEVLATGVPVEIERHGRTLRIVADPPVSKLARLRRRDILRGDPEDFVHMDWSAEWRRYPNRVD
jgi:antitoxin (DNA-binding transcriptional repressor) of toxin-antitoxin stability system